MNGLAAARSLLFVPGDRPDRYSRALASGADLVIVDLEDAVAPESKDDARESVRDLIAKTPDVAVRLNAIGTPWHAADVEAVVGAAAAVMVPKAEATTALADLAGRAAREGTAVIALVETARGILESAAVGAIDGVVRLAFGSFDLAAELGIDPVAPGVLTLARQTLVMASAASGLPGPVDGVWAAVADVEGLSEEARRARDLGFTGKLCIHPGQIATVRSELAPRQDEIEWARGVVESAGSGVGLHNGHMIDLPVLTRAQRILDRLG